MGGIPQTPPPQLDLAKFCRAACRAKFGQIDPRISGGAKLFKGYRGSIWPNFARKPARQNLAKSSRAFLIAFDEQPDLAKFCPQTARQNLAKSSRAFLEARNYLNYRGSIWPNFAGQSAGKIWGLLVVRAEKCAARFGQILPGSLRAKFGQIEPRISHGIRRAARFGQILPAGCPAKFGQIEPR